MRRTLGMPLALSAAVIVGVLIMLWAQSGAGRVAAQAATTVTVRQSATFGNYLADGAGKTLYTLSSDPANSSTCSGACVNAWPPLMLASGQPTAPAGTAGTLAVITRSDNGRQVTYNGAPLYTFARDANPGDTNGEGVNAFGGTWHVAKVAGATAPAAGGAAPTAAPAGGAAAPAAGSAAPAGGGGAVPAAAPRTGTGSMAHSADKRGLIAGLALAALLFAGSGVLLVRRRA